MRACFRQQLKTFVKNDGNIFLQRARLLHEMCFKIPTEYNPIKDVYSIYYLLKINYAFMMGQNLLIYRQHRQVKTNEKGAREAKRQWEKNKHKKKRYQINCPLKSHLRANRKQADNLFNKH